MIFSKQVHVQYIKFIYTNMSSIKRTPNILILADKQETFNGLKTYLKSIVGSNSFTIYNLTTNDLRKTTAWMSNCTLLIDTVNSGPSTEPISYYLEKGGTVLSILSSDHGVYSEQLNEESLSSIKSYAFQEKHFVTKVILIYIFKAKTIILNF
jgi:hypothetical protein